MLNEQLLPLNSEKKSKTVTAQHSMFFAALRAVTTEQSLQRGKGGNDSVRLDSDRVITCMHENRGEADCVAE